MGVSGIARGVYITRVSASTLRPPYAPIALPVRAAVDQSVRFTAGVVRSLRLREVNVSEAFTFRDASGAWFRASLRALDERGGEALVYEQLEGSPESPLRLTLACAVLSRQRMLTVVQKATELGVTRVVPLLTEHSVPASGLAHEKSHAWPGQAVRAVRQCRRGSVPEVHEAVGLERFLDDPIYRDAAARISLDDLATARPADALWSGPSALAREADGGVDVVLLVGPEGGFSDRERAHIARSGALVLRLGTRILRAETAVFAGITIVQHRLGDLHG